MLNPWTLLGSLVVLAALCYGSFHEGYRMAEGEAAKADLNEQRRLNNEIANDTIELMAARDKLRAAEQASIQAQADASAAYQTLKGERDAALTKALAAVASGDQRLYVHATCPGATQADAGAVPQAPTDPGGTAGTSTVELSRADGEFLESLAGEADALADKYRRCQVELANDRK